MDKISLAIGKDYDNALPLYSQEQDVIDYLHDNLITEDFKFTTSDEVVSRSGRSDLSRVNYICYKNTGLGLQMDLNIFYPDRDSCRGAKSSYKLKNI